MKIDMCRYCRVVGLAKLLTLVVAVGCARTSEYTLEDGRKAREGHARTTWKETIAEIILPLMVKDETRYADGYTEKAFRELAIGSPANDAETKLGEPLLKRQCGDKAICWYYSRPAGPSGNYFVRVLMFDMEGRLTYKGHSFYVD